jgi:hypothetical protein
MIFRLLALLLLPIFAYYLVRSARQKFNLSQRQTQILFLIVAALLVVGILIVMGRLPVQFILAPLGAAGAYLLRFLPTLLRLLPFWQMLRSRAASASGAKSGQNSTIRTRFLAMELDHDSGDIDGVVLLGNFEGSKLSRLTIVELLSLHAECRSDSDSQQILEAYLDRYHGEWRENYQGGSRTEVPADESIMTRELALEILGLKGEPDRDEITRAHRTLMQRMHPDRGGSDYLAKKINQAKDFLLKK